MGLSSSTKTTTNKPVYKAQIEGAANNINSSYGAQAPKISAISDQLGTLTPDLLERYREGTPTLNAANDYTASVLKGDYLGNNPHLEEMVSLSNGDVRNGVAASLGTRGLTGGSDFTNLISRAVADNGTKLRYQDYDAERGRMGQAASLAPSLTAAGEMPLASLLSILEAQSAPVKAAAGAGSSIGGLLGSYGTTTEKSSQGLGSLIAALGGSALTGWGMGGFKT